jgi:hypothetical protein
MRCSTHVSALAQAPTSRSIASAVIKQAAVDMFARQRCNRVLPGKAPVAEDTRVRVESANTALGYSPLPNMRERRRALGTVPLIITDILNPFS